MLEKTLQNEIPSNLSVFSKLTEGHDPYHFGAWDTEGSSTILRYWFWNKRKTKKNRKRVFINELEVFLTHLLDVKSVSRKDFDEFCPRTKGDGPCGFAVIIGILEHFQVVEILDGEYKIASSENILQLLGKK